MDPQAVRPDFVEITPEAALRALQGGPYSKYPPSPPHDRVPDPSETQPTALEGFGGFVDDDITAKELREITNVQLIVSPMMPDWRYESRRSAQMVLPFLYLGPSSTAKDHQFLRDQEITLLLAVRDLRSAQASLMSAHKVAQELGIAAAAVDIKNHTELIAAFPHVIRVINEHLLAVHRQQAVVGSISNNGITCVEAANQHSFKRGKVLIFCESGNERSASCVVAYMMAMYGLDLASTIHFVQSRRFCLALGDELRHLLQNFNEILCAQRDVQASLNQVSAEAQNAAVSPSGAERVGGTTKRSATDMDGNEEACMDVQRYIDRMNLAPFSDRADT